MTDWNNAPPAELDRKAIEVLSAMRQRVAWESDEHEALIHAITALQNRLRQLEPGHE